MASTSKSAISSPASGNACSPSSSQLHIESTNTVPSMPASTSSATRSNEVYKTELDSVERLWRDRYSFFLSHGLELRPRYRPGWTPSWIGTNKHPTYCEDAISQILPQVLDAERLQDGLRVCLKLIEKKTNEVDIARYLSSEHLIHDPKNHCVEIYDSFQDPITPETTYIVMPILRSYNDPSFGAVGEVVDFVTQILEGLVFMHSHLVAHGDLTGANIMMDARPIFPQGWHFVADEYSPDGLDHLTPLARIDHPVRYYIVDFGVSERFSPGDSYIRIGYGGRDGDAPELPRGEDVQNHRPYDHFKLDVFTTGNMFKKDFVQTYLGLDFLTPLIDYMMISQFEQRPTAQMALQKWYSMKAGLDVAMARWRLSKPNESVGERVVLNTVAAARQGFHNLRTLFNDKPKTWSNP